MPSYILKAGDIKGGAKSQRRQHYPRARDNKKSNLREGGGTAFKME